MRDAPALFQTQLLVRLIFFPFFNPGMVPQGIGGLSVGGFAGLHHLGCAGGLQARAVPLHKAICPAAAQPGAACPKQVPLHGAVTPLPSGVLCSGALGAGGDMDTPVLGALGLPGVFPMVFFPPNSCGLLDGSQGAKCGVCRKQPGGTACLGFECKIQLDEQIWLWRGVYD